MPSFAFATRRSVSCVTVRGPPGRRNRRHLDRLRSHRRTFEGGGNDAVAGRFQFSERAEPLMLGDREPVVHGYAWRHPTPVASLVVLHGLQSHAQWFAEAADGLVDRGLSVYALERQGSGSSPGRSGDIDSYRTWFDEAGRLVDFARKEQPEVPVHLLGHCFGANVALGTALERPDDVASLVMLTPGLHITSDYSPVEKARIAAAGVAAPQRRFPVPQEDDLFTRDPDVLAWIEERQPRLEDAVGPGPARDRADGRRRCGGGSGSWPFRCSFSRRPGTASPTTTPTPRCSTAASAGAWQRVSFDAEHFLLAEPCRDEVLDEIVAWVSGHPSKTRVGFPPAASHPRDGHRHHGRRGVHRRAAVLVLLRARPVRAPADDQRLREGDAGRRHRRLRRRGAPRLCHRRDRRRRARRREPAVRAGAGRPRAARAGRRGRGPRRRRGHAAHRVGPPAGSGLVRRRTRRPRRRRAPVRPARLPLARAGPGAGAHLRHGGAVLDGGRARAAGCLDPECSGSPR